MRLGLSRLAALTPLFVGNPSDRDPSDINTVENSQTLAWHI